ncbi:hypothetical protein ON058_00025 [Demequina sp. B12]|uniref:hypothetical protein n=1 Tax=Demequina sp. B12 TaxID=2992757 RepID=UPI00237B318C|nr:hypothetical protein [Demequina sp. B12]MDE0571801.1 hypothetical protein [Demequina sp. B12]
MAAFEVLTESVPMCMGMGAEFQPRLKDGQAKLSPHGKATYTTGVVVARADGGADRGLTIAVTEPAAKPFDMGQRLRADGRCWMTPYVDGAGRQAISFTVERLVPLEAGAKKSSDQ